MAPSRKRRLLRLVTRTTLVLVACVVALYLLRIPLFGGMLRDRVARELSELSETPVSIGSVSGSWFADLTLHDIAFPELPADGSVRTAAIERVTVEYRVLDLADDPLAALEFVGIDGLELWLHFAEDDEPIETDDLAQPLADFLRGIPDQLPRARVEGHIRASTDRAAVAADLLAERPRAGEGICR